MKKNKIIGLSVTALAFAAAAGVIGTRVAKEAIQAAGTKTLYCKMEYDWWTVDNASIGIYYWNEADNPVSWPGTRMSKVDGEQHIWKAEIPEKYENVIFTRMNPSDADPTKLDWGAKTKDLSIPTDGKNLFTITNSTYCWGDPGCDGVWSVYEEPAPAESSSEEPVAVSYQVKINDVTYDMTEGTIKYPGDQDLAMEYSASVKADDRFSFLINGEPVAVWSNPEDEKNKNNIKAKGETALTEYQIHNDASATFYFQHWAASGDYTFWVTGYVAGEESSSESAASESVSESVPAESSSVDPFVDESKAGYYYLVGNGSFLNDTYKNHPWSYKAGVEMAKPAEGDDLGQLINQHLEKDDVFKLRVGQDSENTGWVGFSKVQDTSAKKYFDRVEDDNIEVQATGDYNIYINKDGLIYIFDATEPAEISGEIYFAPMAGGAPFADFYLYSWIGNGELESQRPLGDFPGTKLSEIEGVSGTNGLNFHGVYGALFKIPASALGGGEKFVLSTEGEVVKTKDFEYLDGSFYGVGYDAGTGDKSLGAPAALAFSLDAAIKAATGESVCNIETNKAKTLVQDYNKLDLGQKAVFEDSTFYTINSEKTDEKINVTGSAIINMINSHIVNGGEGSLYKTLGMNDSNRTLIITLAVIGAIAIASASFIIISKKRKAK